MSNTPHVRAPSPVAVFDFDGTLTYRDSLFPFLRMAVGGLKFYWGLLVLSPILIGYALGLVPNWQAKQTVLTYFLADLTAEKLHQLGQRFALEELPKLLRREALQRLKWHQQQGHQTVIVSASLEAYLLPWAQTMSFDQVIGTQLEVHNGRLTGRIWGRNCYGLEKVERLKALLGNLDRYCLYAYGDSRGDREILDASHYPYYRSFEDPRAAESQGLTLHWERGLIWSVVAAAVIYAGVVLWSGADQFLAALNRLPAWLIPASLALVFVGYCFRFLRWQWYLYYMSYQVPLVSSFRIFFC